MLRRCFSSGKLSGSSLCTCGSGARPTKEMTEAVQITKAIRAILINNLLTLKNLVNPIRAQEHRDYQKPDYLSCYVALNKQGSSFLDSGRRADSCCTKPLLVLRRDFN